MFLDVVEDNGSGRHVDAHGESLGGEEELDPTPLEKHLHHFLEDGQDTAVVDADAPFEQLGELEHLRQYLVGLLQLRLDSRVDEVMDLRFFARRCQVETERPCFASSIMRILHHHFHVGRKTVMFQTG